jgi:hypothetical protein
MKRSHQNTSMEEEDRRGGLGLGFYLHNRSPVLEKTTTTQRPEKTTLG